MDEEEFAGAVEDGLKLEKRVYGSKDLQRQAPPRPLDAMDRQAQHPLLPTAPTAYAVIYDPAIVDNPDIPSYQPHVYGRCDPPALIPLQMKEIAVAVDCFLDTAIVSVRGKWRLHCVMSSRSCDCRLVIPMSEQGSILGAEFDVDRRSFSTQVIQTEGDQNTEKINKNEDGGFLSPHLFFLTVPQVHGGSDFSLKITWSQKLVYHDCQLSVSIPFNFPEYVAPFAKLFSKREKVHLTVTSDTGKEVLLQRSSHVLKEKAHQPGKLAFLYEAEVDNWSTKDFHFSYSVYSSEVFGGILFHPASMHDIDQREMFCLYLFPGNNQIRKVFRKEVVYVVDMSRSMQGKPLEHVKTALSAALLDLSPGDYFDIIAFNEEIVLFSSSLQQATEDMVGNANQWISKNFVAEGGTNILQSLDKALSLLSKSGDSLPQIFLITDGSVEDERNICSIVSSRVTNLGSISPRISTFGIGLYCNRYFLRMLASLTRGDYDAAYYPDLIQVQLQGWLRKTSSPIVANLNVDIFDHLDMLEVHPACIPDLLAGCPLIVSGRYQGNLPDSVKAKGVLADMSIIEVDLKVQKAKDIPLEGVIMKQQIELLTAQAWFSESKLLEDQVIKLSIGSGIPSEYTCMILVQTNLKKQDSGKQQANKKFQLSKREKSGDRLISLRRGMTFGFGSITATLENLPTGVGELKQPENLAIYKAVGCCTRLCDCCCCMCFINFCSKLNDQCVVVLTQLCTALSCFACVECCTNLCCDGD